jgi:four helix bundle protein
LAISLGNCRGWIGDWHGPSVALALSVKAQAEALQKRARAFFVRVGKFCDSLPKSGMGSRVAPQLIDSAGSANSNYNSACRARSRKEFAAKIGICVEEASETLEWLESLKEANIGDAKEREALIQEANELTAIFTASHKTATSRK